MKRILVIVSCCVMLFQHVFIMPIHAYEETPDFQHYLKNYLTKMGMFEIENVNQPMLHQYVYSYLLQEGNAFDEVSSIVNMANDWGIAISGKTDVYEEVIYEIILRHVKSDVFDIKLDGTKIETEDAVLKRLKLIADSYQGFQHLNDMHSAAASLVLDNWENVLKFPLELYASEFKRSTLLDIDMSSFTGFAIDAGFTTYNFFASIVTYSCIKDELSGIYDVLFEMYRQTQNSELRTACKRVLDKINVITDDSILNVIEKFAQKGLLDLSESALKEMMKELFQLAGFPVGVIAKVVEGLAFFTDLKYRTKDLSQCYLLLEVQQEVEKSIKNVIYYCEKTGTASILNNALIFLYDAYEYGMDIVEEFNDTLFSVESNIYLSKKREIALNGNELDDQYYELEYENAVFNHEGFKSAIKTWNGIIAIDRSYFASALDEYSLEMSFKTALEHYQNHGEYETVQKLDDKVILYFEDCNNPVKLNGPSYSAANSNAYYYTSSDEAIISFSNPHEYVVDVHKTGVAVVSLYNSDHLKVDSQKVIVTTRMPVSENKNITSDNEVRSCIQRVDDGWKIVHVFNSLDYMSETEDGKLIFDIPAYIDGIPVTEIDFQNETGVIQVWPEYYSPSYILFPSTMKRVHEWSFYQLEGGEIIMNEGLELIGAYAFNGYHPLSKSIVIPSTVTSIGEYAFNKSSIQYVDFKTNQLDEIPNYCFSFSELRQIDFSEDVKIKRIGDSAFCYTKITSFDFPDSVQVIGHSAFSHADNLMIDQLPEQLQEIGSYAFDRVSFAVKSLPQSIKIIDTEAFDLKHVYSTIEIPDTIEYIGESAFGNVTVKCYGETDSTNKTSIEPGAFNDITGWNTIEFPSSLKTINQPFIDNDNSTFYLNLIWNEGIDEIIKANDDNYLELCLRLREVGDLGNYTITGHIFSENEVFNYIEIPVNYLKNTKKKLEEPFMKDVVLVGDTKSLKTYVELLKGAVLENGRIIHRDNDGNETLLYINQPQSYMKTSLFRSERQKDYQIGTLSMNGQILNSSILDMDIQLCVGGTGLSSNSKIVLNGWQEEDRLSEADRAVQLGDYVYFEDLYLKQNFYKYFSIEFIEDGEVQKQNGSYIITIKMKDVNLSENRTALYQIYGNRIERIPISFESYSGETVIQFKTDSLGQFALIKQEVYEMQVNKPYSEDLYQLIKESHQNLSEENVVFYKTTEGSQIFVSKDDKYDVVISKPEITNQQKEIILKETEMDDLWIFTDEEKPEQNEETETPEIDPIEDALNQWEVIEDSFVVIDNETDRSKIQVSLPEPEGKEIKIHLIQVTEEGTEDVSKGNVKNIKEKKANELIRGVNQAYYEIELKDSGQYYFFVTHENVGTPEKKEFPVWIVAAAGVGVLIILKKLFGR